MAKHLDRNLYIGGEVKEVYDELIKTLSEDHLLFDLVIIIHFNQIFLNGIWFTFCFKDDYVQKVPPSLNYESSYNSSLLKKFGRTKATNPKLVLQSKENSPWSGMSFREWNKTYVLKSFFFLVNNHFFILI